jgi:hypothetical protein
MEQGDHHCPSATMVMVNRASTEQECGTALGARTASYRLQYDGENDESSTAAAPVRWISSFLLDLVDKRSVPKSAEGIQRPKSTAVQSHAMINLLLHKSAALRR